MEQKYTPKDIEAMFTSSNTKNPRLVVISEYNSRSYQIDDIIFDKNPKTLYFDWSYLDKTTKKRVEKQTNLAEYMAFKYPLYPLKAKDMNQPLLKINYNMKEPIYLVPSLCFEASLPADFTEDKQKMRKLQDVKCNNPK